jgi:hypothetical protein
MPYLVDVKSVRNHFSANAANRELRIFSCQFCYKIGARFGGRTARGLGIVVKLNSVFPFPMNVSRGLPTNLFINTRPDGKFEVARVLPGPQESDFEVLRTCDDYQSAEEWAVEQLKKEH